MDLQDLEKRIGILEDIEKIKQLQYHYVNCLTLCKWDAVIDCFAEDGAVEFPEFGLNKGKAAVSRVFKEGVAYEHIGEEAPYCIHPIIQVNGNRAHGSWLLYIHGAKPHTPHQLPPEIAGPASEIFGETVGDWVQGYYEMEYVKENGQWKFKLLKWYPRLISPKHEIKTPAILWKSDG